MCLGRTFFRGKPPFFQKKVIRCSLASFVNTFTDVSCLSYLVKFQEVKSDYLEQLIVTPDMVAKKIKATNDNKS